MARYEAKQPDSPIRTIESVPGKDNLYFFYVTGGVDTQVAQNWLQDNGITLENMGQTHLFGGCVLIGRSPHTETELLSTLGEKGFEYAEPALPPKAFNPWKIRGSLSIVGQTLQLMSAWLNKPKGIDQATAGFAISNLIANFTNIIFGSQKSKDKHHLRHLKQMVNHSLEGQVEDSSLLPGLDDDRLATHDIEKKKTNFLRRYSVQLGEVGLRMFGAFNMVFPINFTSLAKGDMKGAWKGFNSKDKATAYVGITYLIGKTIALFAKAPDPYNPRPKNLWDTLREKVLFRASSVIEAGAAGYLSFDRFKNRKVTFKKVGISSPETIPDVFGGVGGSLFTTGLIIRYFAPFGERQVDMEELRAHIADSLAQLPEEKLPQAVVNTAAMIANHFGKDKLSFGDFYAQLTEDLNKYHNITIPTQSETTMQAYAEGRNDLTTPSCQRPVKQFANNALKKDHHSNLPAGSYEEKLAQEESHSLALV